MKFVNVGFGNSVSTERIIAVVSPDSAPVKRLIQDAKDRKIVIDATCGRKTRAVLIMDSGNIILSAIQSETIVSRASMDFTEDLNKLQNQNN